MSILSDEFNNSVRSARMLAYSGDVQAARMAALELRRRLNIHASPKISSEIFIVDGLCDVSEGSWSSAIDRLRRAEVVSRMCSAQESGDFSRAWIAHCLFNMGEFENAAKQICEILPRVASLRIEGKHRFAVVFAQLLCFSGNRVESDSWFEAARQIAGRIESRSLYSVAMFNMCALRVWESAILSRLMGKVDLMRLSSDQIFLESSRRYDKLTGASNRLVLHDVLATHLMGAMGKYQDAINQIDELLRRPLEVGGLEQYRLQMERAWCMLENGIFGERLNGLIERVYECIERLHDNDELAFAHLLLSKVFEICDDEDQQKIHLIEFERRLSLLEEERKGIERLLTGNYMMPSAIISLESSGE